MAVMALPPFPRLQAHITTLRQQPRQRWHCLEMPVHHIPTCLKRVRISKSLRCHAGRNWRIVSRHFVFMWKTSRHNRSQTRTAQARRNVTARKHQTLRCEPIQMRRTNLRVPHERVISPPLIVRNDHDDIGRRVAVVFGWRRQSDTKERSAEQAGKSESHIADLRHKKFNVESKAHRSASVARQIGGTCRAASSGPSRRNMTTVASIKSWFPCSIRVPSSAACHRKTRIH